MTGALRSALARERQRLALVPRAPERTLWVHAEGRDQLERFAPVLEALRRAFPRLDVRFTAADAATWHWLRAHHPPEQVLLPPHDARVLVRRFLARVHPRVLVLLGTSRGLGARLLERAARRRVAIALVGAGAPAALHEARRMPIARLCVESAEDARRLADAGIAPARIAGPDASAQPPRLAAPASLTPSMARALAAVGELVVRERPRPTRPPRRLRGRLAASRPGAAWIRRASRPIRDFETLRERLGRPRTILCLGNGPSAEDPALRGLAYDALFRVNWRWRTRGFLTAPDVVFTGDPDALQQVPGRIYGFRTLEDEHNALRRAMLRWPPRRVTYFSYASTDGFLNQADYGARPSNGAVMLATAVALRPERLVIAGVDLFSHPDGAYPGDPDTPNAYLPVHDRDAEVRIIARALASYSGETLVFGEALRRRLGERVGPRVRPRVRPGGPR